MDWKTHIRPASRWTPSPKTGPKTTSSPGPCRTLIRNEHAKRSPLECLPPRSSASRWKPGTVPSSSMWMNNQGRPTTRRSVVLSRPSLATAQSPPPVPPRSRTGLPHLYDARQRCRGASYDADRACCGKCSLRRRVLCADHYYASCSIPAAVGALLALHRRRDGDGFLNYYKGSNE